MGERTPGGRNTLWELSPDSMLLIDAAGRVVDVNPAMARLLGRPESEIVAATLAALVHPGDREKATHALIELSGGTGSLVFETRILTGDGACRSLSWSAVPRDGLIYCVGRDITVQRRAEDALHRHDVLDTVGLLTAGAGHAFNNMLQGITGSLELVQKRIRQSRFDEADRFVARAQATALRAAALTSRLLDFSRSAATEHRPTQLGAAVSAIDASLRKTLGEGIELETRVDPGLWPLRLDVEQLQGAILHLALNACEAMPNGGRFVIDAANAEAAHADDVSLGPCVRVSVTDTGTGMSAASIARAFEPFFTTKPVGEGSGLGLALVDTFARRAGGRATISSEPGTGTTVRLLLPRFTGDHDALERGESAPHVDPAVAETVLVIEDEEDIRALVVDVLDDLGCRALEATDGHSGLESLKLNSERVRLLITDVGLPGLTGHQVADAARLFQPDLKVLFMTGYANDIRSRSGAPHRTSTIAKPFALDALSVKIQEMMRWP